MAVKTVQCFSCPTKFRIETNKGDPMAPVCRTCSARTLKRLRAKERNSQTER